MFEGKEKIWRKQKGFSSPEAVIVVLVIAILTVLAVPNINRTMDLRKLDLYVGVISNKMTEARMHAIKHNRTAWLRIDPVNRTTQLQTTDLSGNTINLGASEIIPGRLGLTNSAVVEFRFDSMGRLSSGTQTVTFKMSKAADIKTKAITVSPAGKITVSSMN
jgi:Tfp pilus assembly protein FimT